MLVHSLSKDRVAKKGKRRGESRVRRLQLDRLPEHILYAFADCVPDTQCLLKICVAGSIEAHYWYWGCQYQGGGSEGKEKQTTATGEDQD
jgi:hypothetical protein